MLLTEEEIREQVGESWCAFPMEVFHKLDKAQLKKVVEWGEYYCSHDNGGPSIKRWACPICRQALFKDI